MFLSKTTSVRGRGGEKSTIVLDEKWDNSDRSGGLTSGGYTEFVGLGAVSIGELAVLIHPESGEGVFIYFVIILVITLRSSNCVLCKSNVAPRSRLIYWNTALSYLAIECM